MPPENRTADYYRIRYAAYADQSSDANTRKRAYGALAKTASLLRRIGVPEEQNNAARVQREFGIAPNRRELAILEQQGLVTVLTEGECVPGTSARSRVLRERWITR
jgi:hypothetical protein